MLVSCSDEVINLEPDFEKLELFDNDYYDCHSSPGKIPRIYRCVSYILAFLSLNDDEQEKKTRDKAIKNLSVFLSDPSRDVLAKPDMDKLWKGIFYSLSPFTFKLTVFSQYSTGFWMSDKPLVQQALATELADLVLTITTTSSSLAFLRGFWETTVREWNGIDRLRCASITSFTFS
jgi:Nucleolar protein,Nop52